MRQEPHSEVSSCIKNPNWPAPVFIGHAIDSNSLEIISRQERDLSTKTRFQHIEIGRHCNKIRAKIENSYENLNWVVRRPLNHRK